MPEKWDFSKIEDQKKFDALPEKDKDELVGKAQGEAFEIQDKVKSGEAKNYDEAEKIVDNENIEKKIAEFEKELSSEDLEKIMDKVQDIDKPETAYSNIRDKKNLASILKKGLLALRGVQGVEGREIDATEWAKKIRDHKDAGYYFNIVGREFNIRGHKPIPRMNYAHRFGGFTDFSTMALTFDSNVLKEEQPFRYYEGDKIPRFKSRAYRADRYFFYDKEFAGEKSRNYPKNHVFHNLKKITTDTDTGFRGTFRLPPRLFSGIVFRPGIKYWSEYVKKEVKEDIYKKYLSLSEDNVSRELFENDQELNKKIDIAVKNIVSTMVDEYKNKKGLLLPIYDFLGNLRWPKKMSYEEVKKFVEEKDKKNKEVKEDSSKISE